MEDRRPKVTEQTLTLDRLEAGLTCPGMRAWAGHAAGNGARVKH